MTYKPFRQKPDHLNSSTRAQQSKWRRISRLGGFLLGGALLVSTMSGCPAPCEGADCEGELPTGDKELQTKGQFKAATSHLKAGDYEKAIELYTLVIEKDPRNRDAYVNRAIAYGGLRNFFAGLTDFAEALELGEEDPEIYYNLGNLYSAKNLFAQAIKSYGRALELDENHRGARLNIGNATAAFEQYGKAIPLYQEYVKRFPERSEGYTNLGSVHEALGDMQKAEDYYEQALTKNSDEPTTFLALGYFFNQQKRYDEALTAWARYLELEPKGVDARKVKSFSESLRKKQNR